MCRWPLINSLQCRINFLLLFLGYVFFVFFQGTLPVVEQVFFLRRIFYRAPMSLVCNNLYSWCNLEACCNLQESVLPSVLLGHTFYNHILEVKKKKTCYLQFSVHYNLDSSLLISQSII